MVELNRRHSFLPLIALATAIGLMPSAQAAITSDATIQVLDQLDVFSSTNLKRSTESPVALVDLNTVGSAGIKSCQNGRIGLTCLDGQFIRNWPVPKKLMAPPTPSNRDGGQVLFSCQDDALALDTRSGPCLSATVDVKGAIWIAARKSSNSHNLIRLVRKSGAACTAAEGAALSGKVRNVTLTVANKSSEYCFKVTRSGRPLLLDISAFDGELAAKYKGPGILGVEDRKTVVFFPSDGSTAVEIGRGSNDWNLNGNEQVQSAALLQRELAPATASAEPVVQTFGLIATSTGRVLWKNMADPTTAAAPLANVNATVAGTSATGVVSFPRGTACETTNTANFFEIRASDTTGRLFIGNRNFCKVFAGSPVFDGDLARIATLTDTETAATVASFKPEGLSVSPGIAVNLADCADPILGCDYLKDGLDAGNENGIAAASMLNVTLAPNSPSGLIVFQIRNIPDCRRDENAGVAECALPGVVVPSANGEYLNVTPMLPQQIKDLFDASGRKPFGLPPLLISPRYEAQLQNAYTFDALFGVTEPGVVFRKSFTAQFDVGDANLVGAKLGCGLFQKDVLGNPAPLPFQQWDITTVVSERFAGVGGPNGVVLDVANGPGPEDDILAEHVDMLANKGCFNPTAGAGARWSMYAFNLQLAEDDAAGYDYALPRLYLGNLLKSLYMDLADAQTRLACANVDAVGNLPFDPSAAPPLATGVCQTLQANWSGTMDKLFKCIDAAVDPKQSQLDQNCGAFDAQFPGYRSYVAGLTPTGADPANRAGELTSRLDVINHVFYDHFVNAPLTQTVP